MKDPKEFSCFDDAPSNNGFGYDIWPKGKTEPDEEIEPENGDE